MRRLYAMAAVAALGLLTLHGPATAAVKPHALIGDGMVLQQGVAAPIWGTADDGEEVKVTFQGKDYPATAKDGKWMVRLDAQKPGGPFEMTITGKNKIDVKNVLVGEVWVCSGQSNMEWPLAATADAPKAIAAAKNPMIRLFTVPKTPAATPQDNVVGAWKECTPENATTFSAVAYFFGRDVQKALDVPVGLIHTSWGGTVCEAWTSRPALEADPQLKGMAENFDNAIKNYGKTLDGYLGQLDKYREVVVKAKEDGKELPPPPAPPIHPGKNQNSPTALYNGMIHPLLPYAIKGAIWYQGESNAGRAYQYRTLFPAMIKNWRADWKQGDFPFLFVQLAPWGAKGDVSGVTWAELREAQLLTAQKLPNAGMAVITDVGDEADIHPRQKEPVGGRLALAALALAYGKKVVYSGPEYESMKVDGAKVVLTFKHTGGGLVAKGGPLQSFTIAGEDRKFVKADAEVRDDKVVVSSTEVAKPVAVRFGWANYFVANLFNKEGLPATPFRTDDFPLVTNPDKPKTGAGAQGQ